MAAGYADQLARGEQIINARHHHVGMSALLARLGRPRPPGMHLSLVNATGPSSYWGGHMNGERVRYRLSTDPDDYGWESQAENNARQASQALALSRMEHPAGKGRP